MFAKSRIAKLKALAICDINSINIKKGIKYVGTFFGINNL